MAVLGKKRNREELNRILDDTFRTNIEDEDLFVWLCENFSDEEIEYIYEYFLKKGDINSIWTLVRFLTFLCTPNSLNKLFQLASSSNKTIRQQSYMGIKRLPSHQKRELLFKLCRSRFPDAVYFALLQLGKDPTQKAIPFIFEIISNWQNNERIVILAIKVLSFMKLERVYYFLERLFPEVDEKIQEEILAAIYRITPYIRKKYIFSGLSLKQPKIREAVYLTLIRLKHKKWEKYIAQGLKCENEEIAGGILTSLRTIKTYQLFEAVFSLALQGSLHIKMIATTTLKRIRSKKILQYLLQKEKKISLSHKEVIFEILSSYNKNSIFFFILVKNFFSNNIKIKLLTLSFMAKIPLPLAKEFLEGLIYFFLNKKDFSPGFKKYIPRLLKSHLNEETKKIVIYTAGLGLLEGFYSEEYIKEFFSSNYYELSLVALYFLSSHSYDESLNKEILNYVYKFLQHPSLHFRYLSLKIISHSKITLPTFKTIFILLEEAKENPCFYELSCKIVGKLITDNFNLFSDIFSWIIDTNIKMHLALKRVIQFSRFSYESFKRVLEVILDRVLTGDNNCYFKELLTIAREIIFLNKDNFKTFILDSAQEPEHLKKLIYILKFMDTECLWQEAVSVLAKIYPKLSKEDKRDLLFIFRKIKISSPLIENIIYENLSREKDNLIYEETTKIVSSWLDFSHKK